jgi:hypothetical protein
MTETPTESNWELYRKKYEGLKATARCPITEKEKGLKKPMIKNCPCAGCESWRTRPDEERNKESDKISESISGGARAAILGLLVLAIGTSIFSNRKPETDKHMKRTSITGKKTAGNENSRPTVQQQGADKSETVSAPQTLTPIPESNSPYTSIDVRFVDNGREINEAYILEKSGQNRRFKITKGQTRDIFALPAGVRQRPIPGPKTIDHSYDLFQGQIEENNIVYRIYLRIHIIRHGNILTRVYAEGPAGVYRQAITPGMRGQNHFGISVDMTDDILSGRILNSSRQK